MAERVGSRRTAAGRGRYAWAAWLLLFFLAGSRPVLATHIVGGHLELRYLRGDTYRLQLIFYFDAILGDPDARDPTASVAIYEKGTNQRMTVMQLPQVSTSTIPYAFPQCQGSLVRTDDIRYQDDVELPASRYRSPNGYYAVWERCCRNDNITNLQVFNGAATALYLEFPAVSRNGQAFRNSSPTNLRAIGDYACLGQPFRAAFGGTDPDGDQLVYDLVTPLNGHAVSFPATQRALNPPLPAPYPVVDWAAGYDSLHQIAGQLPLSINRQTGELTVQADTLGLYVFAVRCTEYRNGVRLGEVRREFELRVLNCPRTTPVELSATNVGLPFQAQPYVPGSIINLPAPPTLRCVNFYLTDSGLRSLVKLKLLDESPTSLSLPTLDVTSGTIGRGDTLVARLCFDACFGLDGAVYTYRLVAEDNDCPVPHRDTLAIRVQAPAQPDAPPTLRPDAPAYTVLVGETLAFAFTGQDTDPDTRVTVRTANLQAAALAGKGISCPTVSGEQTATTTLTWPVTCRVGAGDYDLRLQVISEACGRVLTTDSTVRVRVIAPEISLEIPPNVFTPDGDSRNDTFQPAAGLVPACGEVFRRLTIYNRWGRAVFASPDRLATWSGAGCAPGLYFYRLDYSDRTYKGWVELVR